MNWLEEFWGDLLSEQPLRIMAAWLTLDADSQTAIRVHLQHMATQEGWADSQREAAQVAISVIEQETDHAE